MPAGKPALAQAQHCSLQRLRLSRCPSCGSRLLCSAQAAAAPDVDITKEFPQSQEDAIQQAKQALNTVFIGTKGKKKGKKGGRDLSGTYRVAVEIPIADSSPASQNRLAAQLLSTLPRAAGRPRVIFGGTSAAVHARGSTASYEAYTVDEALAERSGFDGPILLLETDAGQVRACQTIVDRQRESSITVVANAAWLRGTPPAGFDEFAQSFDAAFFFLPVSFGGLFGRGRQAVLFKWAGSALGDQWGFYLDEKGDMRQIGLMAQKPTNEDMETMVHNASAADSPWTAGAKAFAKLTKKVNYNDAKQ